MVTYDDLECAYMQNMFAGEGEKKETLAELYEGFEDMKVKACYI